MKRLEIDLLLQDFENTNIQIEKKLKKLDTIILFYMEENADSIQTKEKNNPENNDDNNNVENNENTSKDDKDNEIPKSDDDNEGKNKEEKRKDEDSTKLDDLPHKEKIDNLPTDIKKLYKKITIKTHPDKNRGSDEYDEYYKRAVKAKEDNDKATLLFIAYELNIKELYDIDGEHFGCIKKRIAELEKKTKSLDNNPFWIWYHADDKHLRRVMAHQIAKMRAKK